MYRREYAVMYRRMYAVCIGEDTLDCTGALTQFAQANIRFNVQPHVRCDTHKVGVLRERERDREQSAQANIRKSSHQHLRGSNLGASCRASKAHIV